MYAQRKTQRMYNFMNYYRNKIKKMFYTLDKT